LLRLWPIENCYLLLVRTRLVLALLLSIIITSNANAETTYVFPVSGCKVTYSKYHHDYPATDIKAKFGCAFVAPTSGVVQDVSRKDLWSGKTNLGQHRGGLSVSIIGDDGVRYYGSHLSKVEDGIEPGVRVSAGQKLGEVGRTGSARGIPKPHLHFGISYQTQPGDWEIRRGAVWPWKYLDAWRAGENLSPSKAVARAAKKAKK
jgi:murein DD-endopeptidase MepM/ murein hydrolase activator NlpD